MISFLFSSVNLFFFERSSKNFKAILGALVLHNIKNLFQQYNSSDRQENQNPFIHFIVETTSFKRDRSKVKNYAKSIFLEVIIKLQILAPIW